MADDGEQQQRARLSQYSFAARARRLAFWITGCFAPPFVCPRRCVCMVRAPTLLQRRARVRAPSNEER